MRYLIVPDVHHKVLLANRILEEDPHDHAIFLGDFFDDWNDGITDAACTAACVKAWLNDPNITCLLGNHDMAYGWAHLNQELLCSGWSKDKAIAVHGQLAPEDWRKFKLHAWIDEGPRPWLISHAGLHASGLEGCPPADYRQSVDSECERALDCLFTGQMHFLLGCGRIRGGRQAIGGINWMDWDEFLPIPRLNQVVGHTQAKKVRYKNWPTSENVCLDTRMRHYAVIEDGEIEIKGVSPWSTLSGPRSRRLPRHGD